MSLLRKIAYPIALLYGAGVYLRNFTYDNGWREVYRPTTRTICVGNLTVGGTGKTPMIEFLVRLLRPHSKVAVLSRGYRRKSKGFLLANPEHTALDLGDEPLQLSRKFSGIDVAVDGNRKRGIEQLEERVRPDVILLDDAFQHRRVKAGTYLLLTTFGNPYTSDHFLPTGSLRDSRAQARRADLIVVTKCPPDLSSEEMQDYHDRLRPDQGQEVLFATLEYDPILKGNRDSVHLEELRGEKITLITGIARPEPLLVYLEQCGLVVEHLRFPDHHFFSDAEIADFSKRKNLLTTEKDYMRLGNLLGDLWYLEVRHRFLGEGEKRLTERLLG